jgi:predicted nucleic acid-binding protein
MPRDYLDAGVLIEAASGRGRASEIALSLLDDRKRTFLSCPYLDFELLPQVILNKRSLQKEFLQHYLLSTERIEDLDAIFHLAFQEASRCPVSGIDALHIAAAHLLGADEFITTEKPGKGLYKNTLVHVVYLLA